MSNRTIQLRGRLFLTFDIEILTGLHIGGSFEGIAIGGVDKTVIRDPLTSRPYIPGSSLRGKVRSLVEKYTGAEQNQRINQGYIHSCQDNDWAHYPDCRVCQVFGVPGERAFGTPARLTVRDVKMSAKSAAELTAVQTDLPFTEVKVEVAIDRVTSQANPRQMERVPAGAVFGGGDDSQRPQPAEMVYSLYGGEFGFEIDKQAHTARIDPVKDLERFATVLVGLQLLEDDYLGGLGSRGSGKVRLANVRLSYKSGVDYPGEAQTLGTYNSLAALRADWGKLEAELAQRL